MKDAARARRRTIGGRACLPHYHPQAQHRTIGLRHQHRHELVAPSGATGMRISRGTPSPRRDNEDTVDQAYLGGAAPP